MSAQEILVQLSGSVLWSPYKNLHHVVEKAVIHKSIDAVPDLETFLKVHKPDFICLLKNPAQNHIHREAVKKASTIGIAISGQSGLQILSQQLVDEALIISDMFQLNELAALELLIAGQQQQPHFPGLTRGLVSMLLYYDGRRCLVNALKMLVQAREGKTWTLGLSADVTSLVTSFTDQLKEDGMIMKVIDLIEEMDVPRELDLLHKNRALGSPRYRKQVTDLINEIKQSLAEVVLYWACQSHLSCEEVMRLLNHVSKQNLSSSDESMDASTFILTFALLYILDVEHIEECCEMNSFLQKVNLVCVPDLCIALHKELLVLPDSWKIQGLKCIFQFALGLSIRIMLQFPISSFGIEIGEFLDDDEKLIETALEGGIFTALRQLIIKNPHFSREEYFLKHIHKLITDFIVHMPIKVKDLRNCGDESARIIAANAKEGLERPMNLPMHFEHFMNLIADMYSKNPLGLDLALDYWCSVDSYEQSLSRRLIQKQVALNKFVRSAGDLLPAPLFVSYHRMLTSLSSSQLSAHHCFNMLKMNGKNVIASSYNLASWDHFFRTLHSYHSSLHEEIALVPDSGYTFRRKMLTKGITPQEVQGLIAVLELMTKIVRLDEVARITLADNPHYLPCSVLLGLVTCSVPHTLKSALIRCLAAFAVSPEIGLHIWQGLEDTQVIPTIPTTSLYYPAGVLMEIEEVETRNEEYPVTLSILKLLIVLLDHPFPLSLGSGRRKPGLQPYLDFVCERVFLRCHAKAYKSPTEKWKIVVKCLKIMEKVLRNYRIRSESLTRVNSHSIIPSKLVSTNHPGFYVMSEMLQDSGFLRTVLAVLDEGVRLLDTYSTNASQIKLEKATKLALSLLQDVLLKQDEFLQLIRSTSCDLLVTALDSLLMNINPRSGQVDHLLVISKFVTYSVFIPYHCLLSVRILYLLCSSNQIAQHLIDVYEVDISERETILHGFVECLELGLSKKDVGSSDGDELSDAQIRSKAREQCLKLLLKCVRFTSPNLSHFLLGFNVGRPVSQTEIQEPGVMGSPRTCLHAVLTLLDAGIESVESSVLSLCYQLVYILCANKDTSGPVLRYLRSNHDFFYRHLQLLPFRCKEPSDLGIISLQCWLLKAIAIELRVTSAHHQRSHVQHLVLSFLDDKPSFGSDIAEETILSTENDLSSASFIKPDAAFSRRKLTNILDCVDFTQTALPTLQLEYFDLGAVQKTFKDNQSVEPDGIPVIDIDELKYALKEVVADHQDGSTFAQRSFLLQQEISVIIQYAIEYNQVWRSTAVKKQLFDAWRQVTEVLLIACPLDIFGAEKKHQIVLEISQKLIHKIIQDDFLPDLMPAVSDVVLTLTATFHHTIFPPSMACGSPFVPTDLSSTLTTFSKLSMSQQYFLPITYHSSFIVVLKAVIESLLRTGRGLQRVRANYYAALLNLLSIIQQPSNTAGIQDASTESVVLDQELEYRKLQKQCLDTMLSFGETVMEVICRDACTAHDITKMLALAILDVAVALDSQNFWLQFLVSKGYLRHILDSLSEDDRELQEVLCKHLDSHRTFYVFESKMALLTRIGCTVSGALALLRNGALIKISECRCIDLRPDFHLPLDIRKETGDFVFLNDFKFYQQVLKAVMSFILSLITSLGSQHSEVTSQLLSVISNHFDFFLSVLRDRSIINDVTGLEELCMVTAVLSRVSLKDPENITTDVVFLENRGQYLFLQHHLLSLLPFLLSSDVNTYSQLDNLSTLTVHETDGEARVKLLRLQIVAHILSMCCRVISSTGFEGNNIHVMIDPSQIRSAPLTSVEYGSPNMIAKSTDSSSSCFPSQGLMVMLLNQSCTQLQNCVDSHKPLVRKIQSISTLTTEELAELLPTGVSIECTTAKDRREMARACLNGLLQSRMREATVLSYIIECAAYILLHHLEFYFGALKKSTFLAFKGGEQKETKTDCSKHGAQSALSLMEQQFGNFRNEGSLVLLDSVFHKLHSLIQHLNKGRNHLSFLEAVTHRMKRIVKFGST